MQLFVLIKLWKNNKNILDNVLNLSYIISIEWQKKRGKINAKTYNCQNCWCCRERERERERELYFREISVANFLCGKLQKRYKEKIR